MVVLDIVLNVLFFVTLGFAIYAYGKVNYYRGRMDEGRVILKALEKLTKTTAEKKG